MSRPVRPLDDIVTVLGMHRSGTSLCANVLHALGVDMADGAGVSPENQRGHWERPGINDLNEQVFALFGRGWAAAAHAMSLPPYWLGDPRVQAISGRLAEFIAAAARPGRAWGFKDPRTARLLPLWNQVFAELGRRPRFVFCVRDPAQVVRSLSTRDRMAAGQAAYRWLVYNAAAVRGVGDAPVCVIRYEDWFRCPAETAARLAAWVGVTPPPAEVAAGLVDASLRHDAGDVTPAPEMARQLFDLLVAEGAADGFSPAARAFAAMVGGFEELAQPFLVELEVLRASGADQARVIRDLDGAIQALRRTGPGLSQD